MKGIWLVGICNELNCMMPVNHVLVSCHLKLVGAPIVIILAITLTETESEYSFKDHMVKFSSILILP